MARFCMASPGGMSVSCLLILEVSACDSLSLPLHLSPSAPNHVPLVSVRLKNPRSFLKAPKANLLGLGLLYPVFPQYSHLSLGFFCF